MMVFRTFAFLGVTCICAGAIAASPSFDCAKAGSSAEEAICADDGLAAMDVELARLYGLAVSGPNMTADRQTTLKATQRGWIKGRDDCWKADVGLEYCVAAEYALRIHELREGYADARAGDGASVGPLAYVCDGLDSAVSAVFINAGDGMASLKWRGNVLVLPREGSGSGSRYGDETGHLFWVQGNEAMFETPEIGRTECRVDETG